MYRKYLPLKLEYAKPVPVALRTRENLPHSLQSLLQKSQKKCVGKITLPRLKLISFILNWLEVVGHTESNPD